MRIIRALLVVFFFGTLGSLAQTMPEKAKADLYADLNKTLGFCMGQKLTLDRIKKDFPELRLQAQKAELEFSAAFGSAENQIKQNMQNLLKKKYLELEMSINKQFADILNSQTLTQEIAIDYLLDVESRAKGQIPSPILETLLIYQFREQPFREYAIGYTRTYRTLKSPKAKGVDFQIRYPFSWLSEDGERPNIIQKFTSENGRGLDMVLLMVKDIALPPGYNVTKQELDEMFSETEMRGIIPDGSKFISAKPITLDNHRAGMVVFDHTMERVDLTLTMRGLHCLTLRGNKMIIIQCMVAAPRGKEAELVSRYERFEPLFKMILNSFVTFD